MKRPTKLDPPDYLSKSPPIPAPAKAVPEPAEGKDDRGPLDPTRYGDWEKKGVAIDF